MIHLSKEKKKKNGTNGKISDCYNFLFTSPSKEATIASFQLVDGIHVVVHLRARKKVWPGGWKWRETVALNRRNRGGRFPGGLARSTEFQIR